MNLVGLPLYTENTFYQDVFPEALSGTLYSFDGTYIPEELLSEGNGYWLNMNNEGLVEVSGSTINSLSISLYEGWNLISGISSEIAVGAISDPNGIIVSGTFYGFESAYVNSSVLVPGKGYWVNALSAGEITIGSGLSSSISEFNDLTIEANELNVNGSSLYFGIEIPDKNKLSYSLPPQPPGDIFDIRFNNNQRLVSDFGEIEVMNPSDVLTIAYEIKVDAGNNYNWVLTSEVGEEHILKNTGEIEVSSTTKLILDRQPILPEIFTLYQNYPNPFNPITTLRYDLPEQAFVTLTIFDMLGREVNQLVKGTQEAGFRRIQWNGSDNMGRPVSAGVYLYQIRADEFVHTRKMMLLK